MFEFPGNKEGGHRQAVVRPSRAFRCHPDACGPASCTTGQSRPDSCGRGRKFPPARGRRVCDRPHGRQSIGPGRRPSDRLRLQNLQASRGLLEYGDASFKKPQKGPGSIRRELASGSLTAHPLDQWGGQGGRVAGHPVAGGVGILPHPGVHVAPVVALPCTGVGEIRHEIKRLLG